jgi:hypothetical protein
LAGESFTPTLQWTAPRRTLPDRLALVKYSIILIDLFGAEHVSGNDPVTYYRYLTTLVMSTLRIFDNGSTKPPPACEAGGAESAGVGR